MDLNELVEDNISCTNVYACSTAGVKKRPLAIVLKISYSILHEVSTVRVSLHARRLLRLLKTTLDLIIFPIWSSPSQRNKAQCGLKRTAHAPAIVIENCSVIMCNG